VEQWTWTWKKRKRRQGEEVANLEFLYVRTCVYCVCERERFVVSLFVRGIERERSERERECVCVCLHLCAQEDSLAKPRK
jgi:hypothetical protein